MAQTVIEKIVQSHAIGLKDGQEVHCGDYVTLVPDHVMTHDNTAAVMVKFQGLGVPRVKNPRQPVFTLDHNIQDPTPETLAKMAKMADFAKENGVDHYPAGRGIGHQIMIEEGYVQPGGFCVASDSHSNTYGAIGALGTPVVRTDAAALWALGTVWWQVPRTIKVNLNGRLRAGVTGKDVIITLCGMYNQGEVLNAVLEFGGTGIADLSMEERLTIANMTTEWGALAGWFPVDDKTIAHMRERQAWLQKRGITDRVTDEKIAAWRDHPPVSDPDAWYAAEINLDLDQVTPHISGPHSLQVATSLAAMQAKQMKIHKAYLVSCTNARREDLRQAADVMRGGRVADGVEMYIAAASAPVQEQAEADGSWGDLLAAGCRPLPPGCGPCIGLGTGLLEDGEVGISATNRNFKGRMGSREAEAYLASPAVVAASAMKGHISGPEGMALSDSGPDRHIREFPAPEAPAAAVEILDGFPAGHRGRALVLPTHNLNTDGIYSKDYTYREDITPEQMAQVVMENYDPRFAGQVEAGDVIVSGYNFGTGSSREQAATALQAAGIKLVIAGSYSQTYLRNAINNGFICVECPALSDAMLAAYQAEADGGARTIIDGDGVTIDFAASTATWRGQDYRFSPLGGPVQEVVIAGGVENQVRDSLK
ncbi:homoaconitase [bacterium DOLJORAL78_65_58]|nr:MAG: homoaconitase [bacterium DOLZORAL124_64_63]PIE76426.1 MAG: homoaconitase [bacterium DOLJORAL78_65_58]